MFGLVATSLKILGIVILVVGFLGVIAGGLAVLFGQNEANDSNDGLLFQDTRQAERGREMMDAGSQVVGTSLLGVGVGLILLVAGVSMGRAEARAGQQQQQQVVVLTSDKAPSIQVQGKTGHP